jgi:hypothetical protein
MDLALGRAPFVLTPSIPMKAILPLFLALAFQASAFDQDHFGRSLNGWQRDGSAHYALGGVQYRTLKPVVSAGADGGEVVTATVIHQPNAWAEVPFELSVAFAPDGTAQSFRIQGLPRGQKVDTGLVTRPSAAPAPAAVEGQPAPSTPTFHPLAEMKRTLFENFDPQVVRAAEATDSRKRDLLARIYGPEPIDPAALAAGLRYNLDLILGLRPTHPSK